MFNTIFPKIHKEGYKFLAISILATFIVLFFSKFLGFLFILITVWVYYFFRDPERFPINDENYLLSPADGIVSQIIEINGPIEMGLENKKFTRISIFMNVLNCHVNRLPSSGKINKIFYKPGKYLNASLNKASEENERNYVKMTNASGNELILVQIAGLIARRIVCEIKENEQMSQEKEKLDQELKKKDQNTLIDAQRIKLSTEIELLVEVGMLEEILQSRCSEK